MSGDNCHETPRGGWSFSTLLEHLMAVINERDRRYTEVATASKDAVAAALTAAKELVQSAFNAAEKARDKADDAQKAYDAGHNDLIRKSREDLAKMVSLDKHGALADRVIKLEKILESGGSRVLGWKDAGSVLLALLGAAGIVWGFLQHHS